MRDYFVILKSPPCSVTSMSLPYLMMFESVICFRSRMLSRDALTMSSRGKKANIKRRTQELTFSSFLIY